VLDHSHTDETSGTWTGLACPSHGLPLGTDVDNTALRHLAAGGEIADLTWEAPDDLTDEHSQVFQRRASRRIPTGRKRRRRRGHHRRE
jgi:hypothetical protein